MNKIFRMASRLGTLVRHNLPHASFNFRETHQSALHPARVRGLLESPDKKTLLAQRYTFDPTKHYSSGSQVHFHDPQRSHQTLLHRPGPVRTSKAKGKRSSVHLHEPPSRTLGYHQLSPGLPSHRRKPNLPRAKILLRLDVSGGKVLVRHVEFLHQHQFGWQIGSSGKRHCSRGSGQKITHDLHTDSSRGKRGID